MQSFCNLCLKLGKSGSFDDGKRHGNDQSEKSTEQMEHARIHFQQLQFAGVNGKTMEAVFKECFSSNEGIDNNTVKFGNEKSDRALLLEFCRTIIKDVPNNDFISCGECGLELKLRRPNGCLQFDRMLKHARSHLGKKLFFCRHCDHGTPNSDAMCLHIKKAHKLSNHKNHYVDLSKNHQDEIQAILGRCFLGKRLFSKTMSKEEKLRIKHNICLMSLYHGNPFMSERHMLMLDLIRKYETESRTLFCRLCSKEISVAVEGGLKSRSPINHALTHLKNPLYRCKRCSKTLINLNSMAAHLRDSHKLTQASREYEDRSGDFHKEILDILKKCYDAKPTTK